MNCSKPNFSLDKHSGHINAIFGIYDNEKTLIENIIGGLESQQDFSTSIKESGAENEYEKSVELIITTILEKLSKEEAFKKLDKTELELEEIIKKELTNFLLPNSQTKVRPVVQAIIPDAELYSEQERKSKEYKDLLDEFFKDLPAASEHRSELISHLLLISSIINVSKDRAAIIANSIDLNENLMNFKKDEYLKLKNYLLKYHGYSGYSSGLYNGYKLNSTSLNNVLKDVYQIIQEKINNPGLISFQDELKTSWLNSVMGKSEEIGLYDVVNAYLNLMYFDKVLEESLGSYIHIDESLLEPIVIKTDDFGNNETYYKYSFNSGNAETVKGWETSENRDAIKEMGKYSKIIIESIPFYKYDTVTGKIEKLNLHLNAVRFSNAITRLFDTIQKLKTVTNDNNSKILYDLIYTKHSSMEEKFPKILDVLFSNTNNQKVYEHLKKAGLTDFDINVLYSIREAMYVKQDKTKSSYYSYNELEQKYFAENGMTSGRYPIIKSILGLIDSIVSMNYLLSTYNHNDSEQQVSIKLKFPTDKKVYEMVSNVNGNIVNNLHDQSLLNAHSLEQNINEYTITTNGTSFTITPTAKSKVGVLSKSNKEIAGAMIKDFKNLADWNNIYNLISTTAGRTELLNDNLTGDQKTFMDMLRFIDDMLYTSFSKNEDGLILFNIYNQIDNNGLEHLLMAASRARIIMQIYDKFEKTKDIHKLTNLQLEEYLIKENDKKNVSDQIYPYVKFGKDAYGNSLLDSSDRTQLFKSSSTGDYLSVIVESEQWLHNLSHAYAIVSGQVSKAVIKNLENKSVPNFSPAFEGAFLKKRIYESTNNNDELTNASSFLIFNNDIDSVKEVVIDTDVQVRNGSKVQVKNMSKGELILHSLEKYFLPSQTSKKEIIIQPTSYSDKSKLINYVISKSIKDIPDLTQASTYELENKMIETIGNFYKQIYSNVLNDYIELFDIDFNEESISVYNFDENRENIRNLISIINSKLKNISLKELIKLGESKNIEIHADMHYRKIGGKLHMNELIHQYAMNVYQDINSLRARLAKEKIEFAESIIKNRIHLTLNVNEKGELEHDNNITSAFIKRFPIDRNNSSSSRIRKSWIHGKKLIIGKIHRINEKGETQIINIVYGNKINLKPGDTFELNPLLENYFMVHSLMGNNIRFSLSGSEINHKIKSLAKLNLQTTVFAKFSNVLANYGLTDLKTASLVELDQAIHNANIVGDGNAITLRNLYNNYLHELESQGQIAQIKRNVIIPATLNYYLQDTLDGITSTQNVAIAEDIGAHVFNFDGLSTIIDAHDGAALIDPFTSKLENKSLQDREVGTVKKPIWHHYNHKYGTAFLAKYAVDTITNQWMRLSEGSDVELRKLFRKMTNKQWEQAWDLLNSAEHRDSSSIIFQTDILESKDLFYRKGTAHYQIIDFNKDEETGDWYTIETEVSNLGNDLNKDSVKVYHYFDKFGNHYTSKSGVNENGKPYIIDENNNVIELHTINSLYELHTAMGGIWSESRTSNGLQYSEASIDAVVNFMNNVTILKPGGNPNVKTQTNYYQPLKHGYISYVANNSAIKNGAANVNSSDVYYNDEELSYMKVSTEGHGIQMDADHTSDEAQMTEFSQVISSLDAGGRLHGYVKLIYEALGQIALELSQIEVQALESYKNTGNISDIYDIIGRTIINNFANKLGQAGLAESIIKKIKNKFNLNSDHALDTFKIPFSDPNIYSNILSTFVSIINGKSIKRKYPGQGTVMVPGYNISQIWEFDDKTYQYEDLVKQALLKLENISDFDNITDISEYNKAIVQAYLKLKQDEIPVQTSLNSFQPTDNVLVNITGERFMLENINRNEVDYEIVEKPWASDPNKSNTTIRFYIKGLPELGYFELVKDYEEGYYSVHFKTGDPDTNEMFGSTPEQRQLLYKNLYAAIPNGAKVSTWGKISFGGRFALSRLMENCEVVETRKVNDREGNFIDIPVYQKPGDLQFEHETNVSLYNINDYYEFKGNSADYLLKKYGYVNVTSYRYRKNIMKARDLAPAKISFKYLNEKGEAIETNIFDTPPLVEAYRKKLKESDAETQKSIQEILDGLSDYKYYHANGNLVDENGKTYFKVVSVKNVPAELIMSNIYKSRFGIKEGLSLRDVLDDNTSFIKNPEVINSKFWDLVFTKGDGKHLYITFNPINSTVDNKRKEWTMINRKAFKTLDGQFSYNFETDSYDNNGVEVVNRVYATDKNNVRLFEIGRDIIRHDVLYDKEKGKFVDLQGNVKKHQKRFRRINESKVSEYVEFVCKNEIIENGEKHTLYNINKKALSKVFTVSDPKNPDIEINKYISVLLGNIYKSQSHSGVQIQTTLTRKSAILLKHTLNGLAEELKYDTNLKEFIKTTQSLLKGATLTISNGNEKENKDFIIPAARYNFEKKKYYNNLKNKIRASFEKALFFTASRIPAQTLQSFMQMKCVGFTGTATNQCFVSHWQTWLQGSDYDIDKAYIMGHNFDDNGVYIGWSNQFRYSSLKAIQASEYLPIPQGRRYAFSNDGYDISVYETKFESADDVGQVKILTKVLNDLNKLATDENGNVLIKSELKNESQLYQAILSHENTKLPLDLKLESFKNFISSHIENTIQNVRNMIGAYTPIDMEVLRKAIDYSDKQTSKKMTLTNPSSIYEMQYASMVGKKVIGIAATGEKASFMWHYWLNDVIREDIDTYKEYGKFSHSLSRLYGRSLNDPQNKLVNCLPDVNLEGVNLEGVERLVGRLPVDGMISQTLSAATDNVKELILDKINAGSKLAKCHLYLITLGYDINDIVNFMANDIINFIDLLTESNVYEDINITMEDAIKIAKGELPENLWKNFLNKTLYNAFKNFKNGNNDTVNKDYLKTYLKTEGEYLVNPYPESNKVNYLAVQEFIDFINELKAHRPVRKTKEENEALLQDIADFEQILAGANEFSNFGRLLGLNQGLPTSKVDLRKLLDTITNIINDRERYLEIVDKNGTVNKDKLNAYSKVEGEFNEIAGQFNVVKFLNDPEYRQLSIRYQNAIKENIPIFKIIEDIPQFKSILELLNVVQVFDRISSVKSRIFDEIVDSWKKKKYYVDEYMLKNLLSYIDDLLVVDFMEKYNYKYPIQKGTITFDSMWRELTTEENIDMSTPAGMVSFKYVFENVVIPKLKKGEFWDGETILQIPELKNNQFIQNLIRTSDKEMPLYKADLDMLEKDSSASNIAKFLEYVAGLKQLQEYKVNGVSLSDWFIIYNLIVNKNHYGSDRLTTLLQEFVHENKSNFLLNYLNHIGKIDYTPNYKLKYSEEDALVATAKTVSSTYGRKEPMLIVNEKSGPTLYKKVGFEYQKVKTLVPEINGEPEEETVQRIVRRILYGSLRINYNSYINSIILNLENFNEDTVNVFIDLMRQGLLTVTNICK